MKFVCISDTHTYEKRLIMPEGDVLLFSGDICYADRNDLVTQEKQIREFGQWLAQQDYEHIVVVAGNHDALCERQKDFARSLIEVKENIHYLDQEMFSIGEFNIWGEPRQPEFFDWAFNVKRPLMKDVWGLVPEEANILVTHGPPYGYGDLVEDHGMSIFSGPGKLEHKGCDYQRQMIVDREITENPFRLIVFGHIHEGYGKWVRPKGPTDLVNASVVNRNYHVVNKPVVIEI